MNRTIISRMVLAALLLLGVWLLYLLPTRISHTGSMISASLRQTGMVTPPGIRAGHRAADRAMPRLLMTGVAAPVWCTGGSGAHAGRIAPAPMQLFCWHAGRSGSGLARWPKLRRFTNLLSRQGIYPGSVSPGNCR